MLEAGVTPTLHILALVGEHLFQPENRIRISGTLTPESSVVVSVWEHRKEKLHLALVGTCTSVMKNELGICTLQLTVE